MKIFFNCLVYKDNDIVDDMILNIKKFVKNPVIVLHVNKCFEDFNFNKFANMPDVYINPMRLSHGQYDTKIKAISSNKDVISCLGINFDYEIIFYPKMLFIKSGIEKYLDKSDLCMPTPTQGKRERMENALNTKMDVFSIEEKNLFNNDIEKFLVEGMCFSFDISEKIYNLIKMTGIYEKVGHCYEEFVFPTVGKYFSKNIKNYPGVISYWDFSPIDLSMILQNEKEKISSFFTDDQDVQDIYFIHKVDYDYNNEIRRMVRCL
jgi:hypothetical protein